MHTTHVRIYYLQYTYIWSGTIIVALYEYFKKGRPVFPTLRTCGEQANTEASSWRVLSGELTGKKAVMPRGKYNSYTQKGHMGREERCWERFDQGG